MPHATFTPARCPTISHRACPASRGAGVDMWSAVKRWQERRKLRTIRKIERRFGSAKARADFYRRNDDRYSPPAGGGG